MKENRNVKGGSRPLSRGADCTAKRLRAVGNLWEKIKDDVASGDGGEQPDHCVTFWNTGGRLFQNFSKGKVSEPLTEHEGGEIRGGRGRRKLVGEKSKRWKSLTSSQLKKGGFTDIPGPGPAEKYGNAVGEVWGGKAVLEEPGHPFENWGINKKRLSKKHISSRDTGNPTEREKTRPASTEGKKHCRKKTTRT